jgi:hypothetical protein
MKVFNFLVLAVILLCSFSDEEKEVRLQRKDCEILREVLIKKEGKLDIHVSEDSVYRAFDKLYDNLDTELQFIDLYKEFGKALATIECGHTNLSPSNRVYGEWRNERMSLPCDYTLVGKKLFVNELVKEDKKIVNYGKRKSQQKNIPKNAEILAIDGQTVPQMMAKIGEFISSDENGIEFKYAHATHLFEFLRNVAYRDRKDSVEVIYSAKRDTSTIYLYTGFPPLKTILKRLDKLGEQNEKNLKNIGKYSVIKSKYAYFKFVSFYACHGTKYEKFLEKSFKDISKKKITKLIVDVRGNPGGQLQYSFMKYIVGSNKLMGRYEYNKTFKRFTNRYIKKNNEFYRNYKKASRQIKRYLRKHPNYGYELYTGYVDSDLIFEGDIIVITDEGSFSAASLLACHLKTMAKAKIVGQTAGGSFYCGNSGGLSLVLPYTKFGVIINPYTFWSHLPIESNTQAIKQPDLILEPINPKMGKKDDWYITKAIQGFFLDK